jgi:hypothetical protein
MKNAPYDSIYYWHNLILKEEQIWENGFREIPLTQESVFIHYVIVNCYGDSDDSWVYFPNVKAALGFLEYVFLPTAFNTLFAGKEDSTLTVPLAHVEELLEIIDESPEYSDIQKSLITDMEEFVTKLQELWELDEQQCIEKLKEYSLTFSERWLNNIDIFFYFNIFNSPQEIGDFIVKTYEEEDMIERIEDQLGLTKDEWLNVCQSVYTNEFMKRKFIEILNNRIGDMI